MLFVARVKKKERRLNPHPINYFDDSKINKGCDFAKIEDGQKGLQ